MSGNEEEEDHSGTEGAALGSPLVSCGCGNVSVWTPERLYYLVGKLWVRVARLPGSMMVGEYAQQARERVGQCTAPSAR